MVKETYTGVAGFSEMQPTIEELHFKNFEGGSKKKFYQVVATLWEKRCKEPSTQPWPPLLQDIQDAMEEE